MNKILKFPQPQVVTVSVPTNFDNNFLEVSFTEKEWGLILSGNFAVYVAQDCMHFAKVSHRGCVKISLKREALLKFCTCINFAASQNRPETRCCRSKHALCNTV